MQKSVHETNIFFLFGCQHQISENLSFRDSKWLPGCCSVLLTRPDFWGSVSFGLFSIKQDQNEKICFSLIHIFLLSEKMKSFTLRVIMITFSTFLSSSWKLSCQHHVCFKWCWEGDKQPQVKGIAKSSEKTFLKSPNFSSVVSVLYRQANPTDMPLA